MAKAQSKSEIRTEEQNYKPENEHCKDDCQEDGTYDSQEKDGTGDSQDEDGTGYSQEEDGTDGSQEDDDTNDTCNKTEEGSLFYGTHEIHEVSEGGEADPPNRCTKDPDHTKFVPVNDFNIYHLPKGYHDNDLFEFIKATADLTVRVGVKKISRERPEFWPDTKQPYPYYGKSESGLTMLGTGMVTYVHKRTEEDIKKDNMGKCQHSVTPRKVWGEVEMCTARHVVFDDLEASNTTCRLFFDGQDSRLVTLDGWTVREADINEDWCLLKCVTCDVDLLDKLDKMWGHWCDLWEKVFDKYRSSRGKVKLSFIVSHPHGWPKKISVGEWINRCKVSDGWAKYTYTTCTCPGSSGAYVHPLGYDGWLDYGRHVHSGVNSKGNNFSAACLYYS